MSLAGAQRRKRVQHKQEPNAGERDASEDNRRHAMGAI